MNFDRFDFDKAYRILWYTAMGLSAWAGVAIGSVATKYFLNKENKEYMKIISFEIKDVNSDGLKDLMIHTKNRETHIYLQTPKGRFESVSRGECLDNVLENAFDSIVRADDFTKINSSYKYKCKKR